VRFLILVNTNYCLAIYDVFRSLLRESVFTEIGVCLHFTTMAKQEVSVRDGQHSQHVAFLCIRHFVIAPLVVTTTEVGSLALPFYKPNTLVV